MDVGTVMFKSKKYVKFKTIASRENSIVNRLNKTKTEGSVRVFAVFVSETDSRLKNSLRNVEILKDKIFMNV